MPTQARKQACGASVLSSWDIYTPSQWEWRTNLSRRIGWCNLLRTKRPLALDYLGAVSVPWASVLSTIKWNKLSPACPSEWKRMNPATNVQASDTHHHETHSWAIRTHLRAMLRWHGGPKQGHLGISPSQSQLFVNHLLPEWMEVRREDHVFPHSRQAVHSPLTSTPHLEFGSKNPSTAFLKSLHLLPTGMKNNSTVLPERPNFKDI